MGLQEHLVVVEQVVLQVLQVVRVEVVHQELLVLQEHLVHQVQVEQVVLQLRLEEQQTTL